MPSAQQVAVLAFVTTFAANLTACGKHKADSATAATSLGAAAVAWPRSDIASNGSDAPWGGMGLAAGSTGVGSGTWKNTVWFNFGGQTATADQSSVVKNANQDSVVIPAFAPADLGTDFAAQDTVSLQAQIVGNVKQYFTGINVNFATEQPTTQPYSTIIIGGHNFTGTADVLGVSPLDIGNFSGTDLIFAFTKEFGTKPDPGNVQLLAHTIAHELAHSFGVRHIDSAQAIMNPTVLIGGNSFDITAPLDGLTGDENSLTVLKTNLGSTALIGVNPEPPALVDLAMWSEGSVAELSIFSPANAQANPERNLADFTYSWNIEGLTLAGPTVKLMFQDGVDHTVIVTATSTDGTMTKTATFTTGHHE